MSKTGNPALPEHSTPDLNAQAEEAPGPERQQAVEPADTLTQVETYSRGDHIGFAEADELLNAQTAAPQLEEQAYTGQAPVDGVPGPNGEAHLPSETPTTAEGGPAIVPPATSPETLADEALANQALNGPDT